MNKAHQLIDEISDKKAVELLELVVYEMKKVGFEYVDLDTTSLDKKTINQLTKPLLKELAVGDDVIAIYLRKQLAENKSYLLTEDDDDDAYRNGALEIASLLILLVPFLKAKWDVNVTIGKTNLSFSGELGYLKDVIANTSTSNTNKNIIKDSQLEAGGNIHVGDKVTNIYNQVNPLESSQPSSPSEKKNKTKEIEQLIEKGKIRTAIDQLLEYFEDRDEDLYQELLLLASRHNNFRKQELLGLNPAEESRLEKNQIIRALIEYLGEM